VHLVSGSYPSGPGKYRFHEIIRELMASGAAFDVKISLPIQET
jgi:hypothetical protein